MHVKGEAECVRMSGLGGGMLGAFQVKLKEDKDTMFVGWNAERGKTGDITRISPPTQELFIVVWKEMDSYANI